jgi:putative phosphoesterase
VPALLASRSGARTISHGEAQTIGVISDTHGLVRPDALARLRGVDMIVHAGDIGHPDVLRALGAIAPVVAVRGNNDRGPWARQLRETTRIELAGARLYVVHDLATLRIDPAAEGIDVVIAGHSHRPSITRRGGVTFLNPGSAGPRRFSLPIALARLSVRRGRVRARIVELAVALVVLLACLSGCHLKPPCQNGPGDVPNNCLPWPPPGPKITPGGVFAPGVGETSGHTS